MSLKIVIDDKCLESDDDKCQHTIFINDIDFGIKNARKIKEILIWFPDRCHQFKKWQEHFGFNIKDIYKKSRSDNSISTGSICYQSSPCQHDITLDGNEIGRLTGYKVLRLLRDRNILKMHFWIYFRQILMNETYRYKDMYPDEPKDKFDKNYLADITYPDHELDSKYNKKHF